MQSETGRFSACRGGHQHLALALLGRLLPEFEHNASGAVDSARAKV